MIGIYKTSMTTKEKKCPKKFGLILKATILKTMNPSLMKLNNLGVEHHKFIIVSIP